MDIFDKYAGIAERRGKLLAAGADPFNLSMEAMHGPTEATIAGRRTILVGTNNYLGLTFDPACIEAGVEALRTLGTGTTGSRIANGTYGGHRALEEEMARFMNRRHAIVFSTGYQANLAMISGLAGPKDVILVDSDWHASIWDGCRLSGATVVRFRHNDPEDLDKRLARNAETGECKLVIVEGTYSMLGDRAPLREFVEVKKKHGAFLLVDEAHSFGVFGANGRGVAEADAVEPDIDFIAGTFSKSLGAIGGFGVSDHPSFELLRVCARPYMFTASPGPATIATVRTALRRIAEEPQLRDQIWANAKALHEGLTGHGFTVAAAMSPIIAVRLPDEATTVWAWKRLLELGVYVNLALPPGTPNGVCLLRCSLSAAHTPAQIDEVVRRFGVLGRELSGLAAGAVA
ncbi:MAG: aminotransferase class I/II-fold pyridoxal phosphate-dependent enzyme [Geminicoccaceae bacterium]